MFILIQFCNNWHNLLKQFPYESPTCFALLFSSRNIKRENDNFLKNGTSLARLVFFNQKTRSYIFSSCDIRNYLYINKLVCIICAWIVHHWIASPTLFLLKNCIQYVVQTHSRSNQSIWIGSHKNYRKYYHQDYIESSCRFSSLETFKCEETRDSC